MLLFLSICSILTVSRFLKATEALDENRDQDQVEGYEMSNLGRASSF